MKRLLPFVIIALVALVTAGLAFQLYRTKMHPPPPTSSTAKSATTVSEPEDDSRHVRGPSGAPVTIEIYGDFQCPPCASTSATLDDLARQYGTKVKIIFYEFPLAMHNHAVDAAMAAEAAGLQGHFWEMHDLIYKYQAIWSQASDVRVLFSAYAKSIGLDMDKFQADAKSPELETHLRAEASAGEARGVRNTPTIFINGNTIKSPFTPENLKQAIDEALAPKKQT